MPDVVQSPGRITRSVARKLAAYELPIPPGIVSVSRPEIPLGFRKPSLSSMPVEIKLMIVGLLVQIEADARRAYALRFASDLDCFDDDRRGGSKTKICDPHEGFGLETYSAFQKPRYDIRALASVDRCFYHLCQPFIWELLDLEGLPIPHLKRLLTDILPVHRHHVRSLWWRASEHKLFSWDRFDYSITRPRGAQGADQEARNALLLRILQVCPRLLQLDIDADEKIDGPWLPASWERKRATRHKPGMLFEPIVRLSALTALCLTAPIHRRWLDEAVVVSLMRDMRQLESFTCVGIRETPTSDSSRSSPSALGLHLATLTHLSSLCFSNVNCINASWTTLDWKAPIRSLSFDACVHLHLEVFDGLVERFAATLTQLRLGRTQSMHPPTLPPPPTRSLNLPKLVKLVLPAIVPLSREFMNGFLGCTNLRQVHYGRQPPINYAAFIRALADGYCLLESLELFDEDVSDSEYSETDLFYDPEFEDDYEHGYWEDSGVWMSHYPGWGVYY